MTYQPDGGVVARLEQIQQQVDQLVIIDNGSSLGLLAPVEVWAEKSGAQLHRNDFNLGVAAAFNQGARIAIAGGAASMLILDQDTVASPTLVADLLAARAAHPRPARVAVVGPVTNRQQDGRCEDRTWVKRRLVISSGSLLSLAAWADLDGFREDYFIDMVEAEYCLRAGVRGYRVLLACRATIDHRIGRPTEHRLLGRKVTTSNHPAWRRYYLMRNRLRVWGAFYTSAPAWVGFDAFGHLRDTTLMLLYEDGRGANLRAVAAGLRDGLTGRMGMTVQPTEQVR